MSKEIRRNQKGNIEIMLDIAKILTISSDHITKQTAINLNREPETNKLGLSVYRKANYGWFIYIGTLDEDMLNNLPYDLKNCIIFAKDHECDWLCLDIDGEIIPAVLPRLSCGLEM